MAKKVDGAVSLSRYRSLCRCLLMRFLPLDQLDPRSVLRFRVNTRAFLLSGVFQVSEASWRDSF